MGVIAKTDEYGILRPEYEDSGFFVDLPDRLSDLLILGVKSMESLDRRLYAPDCDVWHAGAGDDGVCCVGYAGAIMAAELGAPRERAIDDGGFDSELGYRFAFNAVESVACRLDVRDGLLYAAGCEELILLADGSLDDDADVLAVYERFDNEAAPELAGLVAKWKQRGAINRRKAEEFGYWYDNVGQGYFSWPDVERLNVALRELAGELKAIGW